MTSPIPDYGFTEGTFALLVAGRTLHEHAGLTMAHVSRLRALAVDLRARTGVPVVVSPGGDLNPNVAPAEGPVYTRLSLGVVVAVADADRGEPLGPMTLEDLRAGERRASEVPEAFWDEAARIVEGAGRPRFSAAERRAAAASTGHAGFYDGIALDPEELRRGPQSLFLVPSGRLPAADLVWGVPEARPEEDDEEGEEDLDDLGDEKADPGLFMGQGSGQEPHRSGVRGTRVVHANYSGVRVARVDLGVAAQVAEASPLPGAGYFVVPYYD